MMDTEKYQGDKKHDRGQERMHSYTQSQQIMAQTGSIGHLRGDMGSDGEGFFTSWDDHGRDLKTDAFLAQKCLTLPPALAVGSVKYNIGIG